MIQMTTKTVIRMTEETMQATTTSPTRQRSSLFNPPQHLHLHLLHLHLHLYLVLALQLRLYQ